MEGIIDILIKLAGSLAGLAIAYAAKVACAYLDELKEDARLDKFITSAVAAAEQQYKAVDDDGSIRLSYVEGLLVDAGYEITEAIQAMIEGKVFDLNLAQRKK